MIRAEALSVSYGDEHVLRDVRLRVSPGERVALLGANGAGKTTLFRALLGLVPYRGELTLSGLDVRRDGKAVRGRIGYVPQAAPVYDLRLGEFLRLFADLRGTSPERVRPVLAALALPLETHGCKRLRELSGGMLQKAVLALALASDAPLLILDEPTASLDARSRREFLRAVRRVEAEAADRTLLFASHRFDEVERLADRVLVLHGGRFVFDGAPEELDRRADVAGRLWLAVAPEDREAVLQALREMKAVRGVHRNGRGIEISVPTGDQYAILAELARRRLRVRDLRSVAPGPDEMLERIVALDAESGGPA